MAYPKVSVFYSYTTYSTRTEADAEYYCAECLGMSYRLTQQTDLFLFCNPTLYTAPFPLFLCSRSALLPISHMPNSRLGRASRRSRRHIR